MKNQERKARLEGIQLGDVCSDAYENVLKRRRCDNHRFVRLKKLSPLGHDYRCQKCRTGAFGDIVEVYESARILAVKHPQCLEWILTGLAHGGGAREDMLKGMVLLYCERKRQDAQYGKQNHSPMAWLSILVEEVGEYSRCANERHFDKLKNQKGMQTEIMHVAAVALAILEGLLGKRARDRGWRERLRKYVKKGIVHR